MLLNDPTLLQLKQKFEDNKIKKEGTIRTTDKSFGFLDSLDKKESFFIAPTDMKNVLHGDRIIAYIEENADKSKQQAKPFKLVETSLERFIGKIIFIKGSCFVRPFIPYLKNNIQAIDKRSDRSHKFENGDFVVCKLEKHALKDKKFSAIISEFITNESDPKVPWTVSLKSHELPNAAPILHEELNLNKEDDDREDLSDIPFVTIDSEKTKDMDDALYVKVEEDHFLLHVAIADPTFYIDENSVTDKEALKRSFSIYLPGRDIPMLPRELSDDLCSLREGEKRKALVAIIKVMKTGEIKTDETIFKEAFITSHGKLIYDYVSDYLEKNDETNFKPNDEIKQVLTNLVAFTKCRDKYRAENAALFINRPDYDFILTEDGALSHIAVHYRRIANQIVEESMITANIAAGFFLKNKVGFGVFNTHKGFDLKNKQEIIKLLISEGYGEVSDDDLKDLKTFNAIRRYALSQKTTYLDNRIRKMQDYSLIASTPEPHFALGVDNYATWTSPIRKYGDMINHRIIKKIINNKEVTNNITSETLDIMNLSRKHNRMVERDVKDWLYMDYLQDDIKKKTIFHAEVFDITRNSVKLILQENGALVFIPGSFFCDQKGFLEFSNQTGEILAQEKSLLRLGDIIEVHIYSIDRETRTIVAAPLKGLEGVILPQIDKK